MLDDSILGYCNLRDGKLNDARLGETMMDDARLRDTLLRNGLENYQPDWECMKNG